MMLVELLLVHHQWRLQSSLHIYLDRACVVGCQNDATCPAHPDCVNITNVQVLRFVAGESPSGFFSINFLISQFLAEYPTFVVTAPLATFSITLPICAFGRLDQSVILKWDVPSRRLDMPSTATALAAFAKLYSFCSKFSLPEKKKKYSWRESCVQVSADL